MGSVPAANSPVWILRGLGNSPAAMTLAAGRLTLTDENGAVLDAPLAELHDFGATASVPAAGPGGSCWNECPRQPAVAC